MKRSIKNIINIIVIIAMIAANGATIYFAKTQTNNFSNNIQMSNNGQMSGGDSNTPPEIPSGDNSAAPSGEQPSEKPNDIQNDDNEAPPEKPDGEDNNAPSDNNGNQGMQSPDNKDMNKSDDNMQMPNNNQGGKNRTLYYILFGIENLVLAAAIMYLIMSGANKKGIKATFKNADKIIIYILSIVIITAALTVSDSFAVNKLTSGTNQDGQIQMGGDTGSSSDAVGDTEITNEQSLDGEFGSTTADNNAILVKDGGSLTLTNADVTKTGDSSNTENSEFYGINAGILVAENSTATIDGATISTNSKGSNAVFSTGSNSKIYISNTSISTSGKSSARGLDATYGGYIEADNVTITTQGASCASLATDRGEGTVIAKNSKLETNGAGSPVIYSTGDISISGTEGKANGAQMIVIEGKNSATVENSTLICSGAGNRNNVDDAGVMIYQSMSGDADEGTGNFTSKNSSLSIDSNSDYYKTAPMFFITNTDAVISLENTTLNFGSNLLISAKGTDEWGKSGSNGGNITLNATNQTLSGNIELDNISSLEMNLSSSNYSGTINADNTAKSITLTLDKNSSITLTGDSYVTSLENADTSNSNINFNGYTLYVNGKAVK